MCLIGELLIGEFCGTQHPVCAEIIDFDSEITQTRTMNIPITNIFEFDSPITMELEFDGEYK